jgi:hypothetical protein
MNGKVKNKVRHSIDDTEIEINVGELTKEIMEALCTGEFYIDQDDDLLEHCLDILRIYSQRWIERGVVLGFA